MVHHGAGLRRIASGSGRAGNIETIIAALHAAPLGDGAFDDAERALLAYAEKLTLLPSSIGGADIDALRGAGFDDRGIHDACAIVSYFAFVNRIADGLGVELEAAEENSRPPIGG